jgi:chorismate mutase
VPGGSRGDVHRGGRAREAILAGTREVLAAIAQANGIAAEDIASAFFASTADLRSAFPVQAARDLGWADVPLLGATEVDQPGAPPRCIRAPLHGNTSPRQDEVVHVYLRGSDVMRARPAEPPGVRGTRGGGPVGDRATRAKYCLRPSNLCQPRVGRTDCRARVGGTAARPPAPAEPHPAGRGTARGRSQDLIVGLRVVRH